MLMGGRLARRAVLLAALAAGLAGPLAAAPPTDPAGFVLEMGERTVAVLGDGSLSPAMKIDRLVGLLQVASDLPLVARLVLGRHWRSATPAQQQEYVALFEALVVKTMADRLSNYGGERFTILDSRTVDERDTVVSTRISRPGGAPVNVDWRIRETDGRFAIVDVVAEGVSMVVTQRSEVAEIVSSRGIDGLLATMRERLARPA